jgi:hypothetical protein
MKLNMQTSPESQALRRNEVWKHIRATSGRYFDADGRYDGNAFQPGLDRAYDQRVVVELAIAFLHGDSSDREFAEKILRANDLNIGFDAFTMDYILALWHAAGEKLMPETRQWVLDKIRAGSQCHVDSGIRVISSLNGTVSTYSGFNFRGGQWHGYNDNHVAMAMSSLILGGELIGDQLLVEAGRCLFRQMRDTLSRRGFIHEANDCYLPHTMYPLAAIAAWAKDAECRELAQAGLDRIWSDLLGHWHPNLGRKLGPSARDYTQGRLSCKGWVMFFHYVFGPESLPGWLNLDDIFAPSAAPVERKMQWPQGGGTGWNLGFLARIAAQPFQVPEVLQPWVTTKPYPFEIIGTNEFGNMLEIHEEVRPDGTKIQHGLNNVQFAGGSHLLTTYMEEDWGMGTADQRLLGGCPNNNWQLSYRKQRPLSDIRQQGNWFCSFTINDKCVSEENHLQYIEGMPESKTLHGPIHFADAGRFAGLQHQRTAMLVYRPRPLENWAISSLALSLVFPMHFGNDVDEFWLGDERVKNWSGSSTSANDIFIKDGPLYIGFRPLTPPWRDDLNGSKPAGFVPRLVVEQRGLWGCIHLETYRGEPISVRQECDLARLGNGFIVEVATEEDFASLDAFKAWFRAGQVADDTFHWQRQVRYHRAAALGQPKLDLALRWDAWQDRIMFRALNGRSLPEPIFKCTGLDNAALPWLTGDVSGEDHFSWLPTLLNRPQHKHGHQPLSIRFEK